MANDEHAPDPTLLSAEEHRELSPDEGEPREITLPEFREGRLEDKPYSHEDKLRE